MRTLGNIIWCILIGLWAAIGFVLIGLLLCITIIGIPFGKQLFKLASLIITPFGKEVKTNFEKHPILNIIWIIFFGWEMAIGYIFAGVILCILIVTIPFGKQAFKLTKLAFIPFGAEVLVK